MPITISEPANNATVPSSFTVKGTFTVGAAGGNIQVFVYQNDGTTPLPNTIVTPAGVMISPGTGNWSVTVTRNGAYNGAVIKAVLTPNGGGTPENVSVTGINIQ